MTTLYYTVGLPASGKSTWAKAWQAEHPTTRTRANRDDLRAMMHGSKWSGNNEKQVVAIQNAIIADSLSRGRDVVVDDTNLHPDNPQRFRDLAEEYGAEVHEVDFTYVLVDECIRRDALREDTARVGRSVIERMYRQYLAR